MTGLVIKVPQDDWKRGLNPFKKKFWGRPWVFLLIPLKGRSFDPEGVTPCKPIDIREDQLGVVTIEEYAGLEQKGSVSMDLKFIVDVAVKDEIGNNIKTTPQMLIRGGQMGYYVEKLCRTEELQSVLGC